MYSVCILDSLKGSAKPRCHPGALLVSHKRLIVCFLPQSNHRPPLTLHASSRAVFYESHSYHARMNKPHSTTADVPVPWPHPLWAIGSYSYTSVPQRILQDLISALRHLSTASFDLPIFNATNGMGVYNYKPTNIYVSGEQPTIRTSTLTYLSLTLLRHSMSLVLQVGPCWPNVRPCSCLCYCPSC